MGSSSIFVVGCEDAILDHAGEPRTLRNRDGKDRKNLSKHVRIMTMLAIIFVVSEDATRRRVRNRGESAGSWLQMKYYRRGGHYVVMTLACGKYQQLKNP